MKATRKDRLKIDARKVVRYWTKTSENDWEVARSLFERKHYSHALFFGHLTLEKLLKALVVERTGEHAPYLHKLLRLAELAGLAIDSETSNNLQEISDINIEARYLDDKYRVYKKTNNRSYADKYFTVIDKYRVWLKKELTNQ